MRNFKAIALAAASIAWCASTSAGIIEWDAPTNVSDASDVVTDGLLVEALNLGGTDNGINPATDATVNGVTFQADDSILSNSTSSFDFLNGQTTSDTEYDKLLSTLDFGNGAGPVSLSLPFSGQLVAGTNYLVQLWFTDLRSCCSNRVMTIGDGNGNSVDISANSGGQGLGQFAVGRFSAGNDTAQTLTLSIAPGANVHLNAIQLRDIPSPAPIALLSLGLVWLRMRAHRN